MHPRIESEVVREFRNRYLQSILERVIFLPNIYTDVLEWMPIPPPESFRHASIVMMAVLLVCHCFGQHLDIQWEAGLENSTDQVGSKLLLLENTVKMAQALPYARVQLCPI